MLDFRFGFFSAFRLLDFGVWARRVLPYPEIRFLMFGRNGFLNRRVLGCLGSGGFFGRPIPGIFVSFLFVRSLLAISGDWIFALCSESVLPSTRRTISG